MDGQNIVNMIKCRRGTHPLFRSFGMGTETDDTDRITRGSVQVEVNRWYPGSTIESFKLNTANIAGEFGYSVNVRGV